MSTEVKWRTSHSFGSGIPHEDQVTEAVAKAFKGLHEDFRRMGLKVDYSSVALSIEEEGPGGILILRLAARSKA